MARVINQGYMSLATFEVPPTDDSILENTPRTITTVMKDGTPGNMTAFVSAGSLSPTGIVVLLEIASSFYVCYHSNLLTVMTPTIDAEVCTSAVGPSSLELSLYWDDSNH